MPKGHPNWGGYREGSGQKPKWRTGETRPIRLPVALHEQVFLFARLLDTQNETLQELLCCDIPHPLETVTKSNQETVTLSSFLNEFVEMWRTKVTEGKGPRWDKAKKMLTELEALLAKYT